jgi:O-antigen/teichoic acid export membrane protein
VQKKRYEFEYKILAVVSIIYVIIEPTLECFFVWKINHMYGRIYGLISARFLIGGILYFVNIKKINLLYSIKYWKYILVFCLPLIPHFLSTQILSRIDRIMIEKMCDISSVAYYSLAYSVSMLMTIVSEAIHNSYIPYTYQCIRDGKIDKIKKTSTNLILLVAGMNFLLILFAPEAIRIFAPKEYLDAVYIIPAVSASVFFAFLYNLFANIEYYYGKTSYVAVASIGAAVINILLNYYFIPKYGYVAAGYTTLISYILYALGHFLFMRRVSSKYAGGVKFYSHKSIVIISVLFILFILIIIPLYNFWLIRYGLVLIVLILMFYHRNKWIDILKRKNSTDTK